MSSCLSGGGRTYGFDLEIVKSPSTSTRTTQTSSPSSTVSESSNSQLAISTRKPRTARKRPNQTYNEAAVLLSSAYPNIFPIKHISEPLKVSKLYDSFSDESSDLFLPFHQTIREKPDLQIESKVSNFNENLSQSRPEIESQSNFVDYEEDFDTESILDEEIEEGIDSIMGNLCGDSNTVNESINAASWFRNPMGFGFGLNFEFGFAMRSGIRALKSVEYENLWNFSTVNVREISPELSRVTALAPAPAPAKIEKKKKKGKKIPVVEPESPNFFNESVNLRLKLNYQEILNVWSERELPDSDQVSGNGIYVGYSSVLGKSKSKSKSKSKKS